MIISFFIFLLNIFYLNSGTLILSIEDIKAAEGCLQIALFDSEAAFLQDEKASFSTSVYTKTTGTFKVEIPDLAYGTYAIAIFHDENNNGKLDKNIFGVPVEPYSFSNNPKIKWRGPQFEESKFDFNADEPSVVLKLRKWAKQ